MRKLIAMIILFSALYTVKGQNGLGFETMVNALLDGTVDTISANSLELKLQSDNLLLLDARESDEYGVSHLPTAVNVGYEGFNLDQLLGTPKDQTIVVYCSVGKRSEEVGKQLKEDGFTNVYNLYGGIFDWTNRGLPVVDSKNVEVKQVHPYNTLWGFWVNNYEKRYEPR